MALFRKIAVGLLLAASAGVLLMAALELWNYRQWASLQLHQPAFNADDRGRILEDRVDLLTRRIGDMELLSLILLGSSGLYALVFAGSSYFTAVDLGRRVDRTVRRIQDQIGFAREDLRELRETAERKIQQISANPANVTVAPIVEQPARLPEATAGWAAQVAEITARLSTWHDRPLNERARLALMQDENATAYLEVVAGSKLGAPLAGLYLSFGRIYASSDSARSRFYLERALHLAAPNSPLASEIRYQLACLFAVSQDFPRATRELAAAFEHQFKTLDEKLASDIEEGGKLYELASTPPFDKVLHDLLLNMSIGIG